MSNGDRVVLVVDDDEMIRRLVRTVLEADDFKVV
jgi:DNA-binding response OmpR family regulator